MQSVINGAVVDWQKQKITLDNESQHVEPKVLQVLALLHASPGVVFSYEHILNEVWPNTIVTSNSLQRCITRLRQLLQDSNRQVIQTIAKKGYCLNPEALKSSHDVGTTEANDVNKTLSIPRTPRIFAAGALLLCLCSVFVVMWLTRESAIPVLPFYSLTGEPGDSAVAISADKSQFVFQRKDKAIGVVQIWHQQVNSGTQTLLTESRRIEPAMAIDQSNIWYVHTVRSGESNKCQQIQQLEVSTSNARIVSQCMPLSVKRMVKTGDESLLLLVQQRDGLNELQLLDVASRSLSLVSRDWHQVISFDYQAHTRSITLLVADKVGRQRLVTGGLQQNSVQVSQNIRLSQPLSDAHVRWWQNKVLIQQAESLFVFDDNKLVTLATIPHAGSILSMDVLSDGQLVVQTQYENWDVHLSQKNAFQNLTLSNKWDRQGLFRPGYTQQYSFLSDRSGLTQIWLTKKGDSAPLTSIQTEVTSYLWHTNGHSVFYVTGGQLFVASVSDTGQLQNVTEIPLAEQVQTLMQHRKEYLLFSAVADNQDRLIQLNLDTLAKQTLLSEYVPWAQAINDDILIYNNPRGGLTQRVRGNKVVTPVLSEFIVQWQYRAIEQKLYFQDKHLNIWMYDPIAQTAQIESSYDDNSVFMTDYLPDQKRVLSDNFKASHSDLLLVTLPE